MDHKTTTERRKTWELFSVADKIAPPSEAHRLMKLKAVSEN